MIRNCRYANAEQTAVDCDLNHTEFGWIPTTVMLDGTDDRLTLVELVKEHDIDEFAAPAAPEATVRDYEKAVQLMHDNAAQARGYDNINSCAKYVGYDNPFRAECEALCGWAAHCWSACYDMLNKWQAGEIEAPTVEQVIELLPELSL